MATHLFSGSRPFSRSGVPRDSPVDTTQLIARVCALPRNAKHSVELTQSGATAPAATPSIKVHSTAVTLSLLDSNCKHTNEPVRPLDLRALRSQRCRCRVAALMSLRRGNVEEYDLPAHRLPLCVHGGPCWHAIIQIRRRTAAAG